MSLQTIIAKAGTNCDFRYEDSAIAGGAQREVEWKDRYTGVPCRYNTKNSEEQQLFYDQFKVFARGHFYIEHLAGITDRDRVIFKGREFEIILIENYDEIDFYLKIHVQEWKET